MEKFIKGKKSKEEEMINNTFNNLQMEQMQLATKLSEIEHDINEHGIVIETIDKLDKKRKCFRMIGGVLVERTIDDVLPTLIKNRGEMEKIIKKLNEQLTKKEIQINQFKKKHNIQLRRGATPLSKTADSQINKEKAEQSGSVIINNV